jgi:CubicO group peptidase (beta-lactamase class C family)
MRVRQLLDFTSGLEAGLRPLPAGHARALAYEVVAPPGERFQYGPSHLTVFADLLRRKLGGADDAPLAYLHERLLDPLGLEIHAWREDAGGGPDLVGGAVLRAREWAKFGVLIADEGRSGGRALLAPESLRACFVGSRAYPDFGLTFWLNRGANGGGSLFYPGGLADLVVASGAPKQRLYVIPSRALVVVRFGAEDRSWRDREFLEALLGAGSR